MKLDENLFNTNRSVRRTHLTEKLWTYQLPQELANNIRNSIDDMEFQNVIDALIAAYEWMRNNIDIIDDEEIDMWIADLESIDLDEDEIDYQLNEFYDLCDNIGIFVPFAEVEDDEDDDTFDFDISDETPDNELEEDVATPTTYTMGTETTNDQNKFYSEVGKIATDQQMKDLSDGKPVAINGKNYQINKDGKQNNNVVNTITNESYNDFIVNDNGELYHKVFDYVNDKIESALDNIAIELSSKFSDYDVDWAEEDGSTDISENVYRAQSQLLNEVMKSLFVNYPGNIDESLNEENKQDRTIPIEDCIITDEHLPDDDYWTEIYWKTHKKWGE